jgi:hypothetical protein
MRRVELWARAARLACGLPGVIISLYDLYITDARRH